MAATNETNLLTLFLDAEPCLDFKNPNNANPNDCYGNAEPFLTLFSSEDKKYLFYFGF